MRAASFYVHFSAALSPFAPLSTRVCVRAHLLHSTQPPQRTHTILRGWMEKSHISAVYLFRHNELATGGGGAMCRNDVDGDDNDDDSRESCCGVFGLAVVARFLWVKRFVLTATTTTTTSTAVVRVYCCAKLWRGLRSERAFVH